MNEKNLLFAVLAHLERERKISIPQLAKLLNVTEEEVWNALNTLVFCFDRISVRLELEQSFATLIEDGHDELFRLTGDETDILVDALVAHGFSTSSEITRKLVTAKGDSPDVGDMLKRRIRTAPQEHDGEILQTLAAVCEDENHRLLQIDYQKEGAVEAETRQVEPYAITSDGDHRYLYAYCHKASGWRRFRIDRIKNASVLEERFDPREVPPLSNSATQATLLLKKGTIIPSWDGIKKSHTREDGSVELRIPWYENSLWLPKHIVAQGGAITPLAPQSLVDATKSCARMLLES